jgi:predicted dehydrogenase
MGWADINAIAQSPHVNVVALCDVDESANHLGRAAEKFPKAARYTDWRKLLEQKDIDAVQVSTPDHMHAPVAFAAMQLGKHVYCQKPLTHTVAEARLLAQTAKKTGVVTQMGNQIQAYTEYRGAVQLVQDGAIGKVKEVFSWQAGEPGWPRGVERPEGADPIPPGLHWDLWLGTAPERPFKAGIYHPFNWRGWQHFSNGQLGDFGCHILDPVFMALELTAPTTIRAQAPSINRETWTPWATVNYEFPGTKYTAERTIKVAWIDGNGKRPLREQLPSIPANYELPGSGSVFVGERGSLVLPHVGAPQLFPSEAFASHKRPELAPRDHYRSWVDAMRGEDKAHSNFGYSGPLTETVLLGTIAIRLPEQTLTWNAAEMKLEGAPGAAALLTKSYRKGWELPL